MLLPRNGKRHSAAPPHRENLRELQPFSAVAAQNLLESMERDIQRARHHVILTLANASTPWMRKTLETIPCRRYMLPAFDERNPNGDHPKSSRDSLHEADMWAVEGLTHRYPTKVLAEIFPRVRNTAHCTRMDLVATTSRK